MSQSNRPPIKTNEQKSKEATLDVGMGNSSQLEEGVILPPLCSPRDT